MKTAILGDYSPGYICPMTKGLERMLGKLGCETVVLPHGIKMLSASAGLKGAVKRRIFRPYFHQLAECDAIIVVQHLKDAFRTSLKINELRLMFPDKPVILYDLVYLPTVGLWGPWLEPTQSNAIRGMDLYDWYLCVSVQNRLPMPAGDQPCTEIGIDLNDGSLFPDQRGSFKALMDFEREAFPDERRIQLEALEETGTEYEILKGRYSIADIREIYRGCSIYFLAHMESFGVPICELQACGCRILTPYDHWCDAHRLPEGGGLSPNFTVYENHKKQLINSIEKLKAEMDPAKVVECFRTCHGHFMDGDPDALQTVLDKVGRNEITGQSHREYKNMTEQIPARPGQ